VIGEDPGPEAAVEPESSQLSILRARMEDVEDRIAELGPDHATTPRLIKAQLQLQTEISRLVHSEDVAALR
jgi:hypothetical protein